MSIVQKTALALVIIGSLNWGLAGFFRFDIVAELAGGPAEPLARFIYIIIGVSGLFSLGLLFEEWRNREVVIIRSPEPKDI
ncbi:DUF378 domain-containing protein [Sporosarcina sp. G11-34]|uniref:DUF378 domain-containing protein n=1 Tax=Sporosarcina sp. G11-34 TaxID=2849605 RepID=UPI0022A8FE58|nr:DUF378 domain-containing protein [Sporosarcina sp. G11-34]MCZ2260435.1 DUF378 domain-containing protein [Sporosarcina sp. G11-34]